MSRRQRGVALLVLAALAAGVPVAGVAEESLGLQGYQAKPAMPTRRLLVVGDSTAVGAGASRPERSLVGLIGQAHPDWTVLNLARDGAQLSDIAVQLNAVVPNFDTVLILGGGNDVMKLSSDDEMREQLARILKLAKQSARDVVLMPAGNVGNAPLFFWPLSRWMTHRSRGLHALAAEQAARQGAVYVNLFKEREADPFVARAAELHAGDGVHPSDAGYALWFQVLRAQAPGLF
jgi:lysophospholipase L1-like esterase